MTNRDCDILKMNTIGFQTDWNIDARGNPRQHLNLNHTMNCNYEEAIELLNRIHSSNLRHDKFGSGENLEASRLEDQFKKYPKTIQTQARSIAYKQRQEKLQLEQKRRSERRAARNKAKKAEIPKSGDPITGFIIVCSVKNKDVFIYFARASVYASSTRILSILSTISSKSSNNASHISVV